MGCDIHFFTEKRNAETGKWELVGKVTREDDWVDAESLYDGRNYNLFAILADVRNGRGFAGVKTGEGFNPISEPRGVPEDASAEYREIVEQWDCDGHSHSYHTLRQLIDFDWTQDTGLQGWVTLAEWVEWTRWKRGAGLGPDGYCGGVSGPDVRHLKVDEMDALNAEYRKQTSAEAKAEFLKANPNCFGLAKWSVPYYRAAGSFISETLPQLLDLAGGSQGLDNLRVVFFFDN